MTRALVFAAAVVLAVPASALGVSFVIQGDYKIGGYAVKTDGTLRGVIDEYGPPTSKRRRWGRVGCLVTWRGAGLSILFYNLGGGNACMPDDGRFRTATMTGRLWRTSKGLKVGDSVARLRRLYPRATFHAGGYYPRTWWLVTRYTRIGDNGFYPGLRATVRDGLVRSFVIEYAAGGD